MTFHRLPIANAARRAPCASLRIASVGAMAGIGLGRAVLQVLS